MRPSFRQLLRIAALLCACALPGCTSATSTGESMLERNAPLLPKQPSTPQQAPATLLPVQKPAHSFLGLFRPGNDQQLQKPLRSSAADEDGDGAEVTLNLVDAPIAQAAKAVMGDSLQLPYSVDARVQGKLTIQTPNPVTKSQLMSLFESALRDNGALMLRDGGGYRIVPATEAVRSTTPVSVGSTHDSTPGVAPRVVPLKYISADDMRQVLEPMLPQGFIVSADQSRNALILAGSSQELASVEETISVFDVDWLKGMSFALIPVRTSSPAAIVRDLDEIFSTRSGPLKGVVRFVPNSRLKAVLVISSRARYLKEAGNWIKKLDVLADANEASFHVYHVQNRTASTLTKLLDSVLAGGPGDQGSGVRPSVAPRFQPVTATGGDTGTVEPAEPGYTPPEAGEVGEESSSASLMPGTRVVSDDSNNTVLIYAPLAEYEKIRNLLAELDTIPNQVLLEAIIAEVTLDDELKFGVRWYFGQQNNHATFSDVITGSTASVFPGFSYFLKSADVSFTLNALSSLTKVRVLSAPSLVVLDNHMATLQVGDQVPVVTQSAQSTDAPGAPLVSTVEMKDTGVILHVTPRVNDSGLVTLDIEQEVSNVVKTLTSGIDSPTIRQRRIKTSVAVSDDETIALGGLIQDRETAGKTKVPIAGDVPVLGAAFGQKTDANSRTELIIFIRPRVIRDMEEAKQVTEEFRRQLSIEAPPAKFQEPTAIETLGKILN